MSKTKKKLLADESIREREAPAHRSRREAARKVEKYVGPIEEELWDEESEEIQRFEPIKRKNK